MKSLKEWQSDQKLVKFRASIYVDIFVPDTGDVQKDRKAAEEQAREYANNIPNSYVGGVAKFNGMMLDREI